MFYEHFCARGRPNGVSEIETHYQLDHRGDKDNNYTFVVKLIHNLARNFLLVAVEVIREAHCCLNIK